MGTYKIKICGLTDVKEAEYLNENKVDFAGMVMFFPKSKRNIEPDKAKEIISALSKDIKTVAVTVSPDINMLKVIEKIGFDYIQIHKKLSEEVLKAAGIPILRAFNVSDMSEYEYIKDNNKIAGYVFDAAEPGSGKVFDWSLIKTLPRDGKLWLLAGGLNSGNIAEAIKYINPDGADVSSGVENDSGMGKSPEKIKEFVDKIRSL